MASISVISFIHFDFECLLPGFYLDDKIHLSDIGLGLFNLDISCMVEEAIWCLGGAMPC